MFLPPNGRGLGHDRRPGRVPGGGQQQQRGREGGGGQQHGHFMCLNVS